MDVGDELSKLSALHDSGALTDDEFAQAKQAVLNASRGADTETPVVGQLRDGVLGNQGTTLGEAASQYVRLQTAMAVVGLIVFIGILLFVFMPMANRMSSSFDSFGPRFAGPAVIIVTATPGR